MWTKTGRQRDEFTLDNPKTAKGEPMGYMTAILHLAPAMLAGVGNVCPNATDGCKAACLNTAGRGGMPGAASLHIHNARVRRTRDLMRPNVAHVPLRAGDFNWTYINTLVDELKRHKRRAERKGLELVVRPNGTSDLPKLADALMDRLPDVQFYDYTKNPRPYLRARANYSLTFSRSERNEAQCLEALRHGINVCVVFRTPKGKPLPSTFWGREVIDGDEHDLRFLDGHRRAIIVGVRAKGKAKHDTSGFVVDPELYERARVAMLPVLGNA